VSARNQAKKSRILALKLCLLLDLRWSGKLPEKERIPPEISLAANLALTKLVYSTRFSL